MPLKLNVGASRKVTDNNYGSRGASVNLELELDGGLVNEPAKLRERIRQLFGLVRVSLADELNGGNGQMHPTAAGDSVNESRHGAVANGTAPRRTAPRANGSRPATPSQVKAIYAIARGQRLDLAPFLLERFQAGRPDELTLQQASQAIDALKSREGQDGESA
jgi:hypothetical protein